MFPYILTVYLIFFSSTCVGSPDSKFGGKSPEISGYNYMLGTQAIGGKYQFTSESKLLESAQQIRALGSNIMKLTLSNEGSFGKEKGNVVERPADVKTLVDLISKEPSHRTVLEMPFTYYFLWTYPLSSKTHAAGFKPDDREAQYAEMKSLAVHLLKTYNGSGKQFYLGHWEGDWHLRSHFDPKKPLPEGAQERFTDWLKVRQRAIDDAKRETPHHDVAVWHYTEVNLVMPYLKNDGACLTNNILPEVDVDFVSYSCYDALQGDIRKDLHAALNHIESQMRPKAGISGKRVFIGEYGFPAKRYSAEMQNRKSIEAMLASIEWGCPFVLYWELYCNEFRDGRHEGFWLIDDQNVKQPVWHTHENFYTWAKKFVRDTNTSTGKSPTDAEFRKAAIAHLREALTALDAAADPNEKSPSPPRPIN
jgi:hypothetical protein